MTTAYYEATNKNSVFLSQYFSQNSIFQSLSAKFHQAERTTVTLTIDLWIQSIEGARRCSCQLGLSQSRVMIISRISWCAILCSYGHTSVVQSADTVYSTRAVEDSCTHGPVRIIRTFSFLGLSTTCPHRWRIAYMNVLIPVTHRRIYEHIRFGLFTRIWLIIYGFNSVFSHNKSASNTFSHGL